MHIYTLICTFLLNSSLVCMSNGALQHDAQRIITCVLSDGTVSRVYAVCPLKRCLKHHLISRFLTSPWLPLPTRPITTSTPAAMTSTTANTNTFAMPRATAIPRLIEQPPFRALEWQGWKIETCKQSILSSTEIEK
jgi:hypothetical protein